VSCIPSSAFGTFSLKGRRKFPLLVKERVRVRF